MISHSLKKTTKKRRNSSRILVIDDDESILDAIRLILETEGYFVETTFKGEETFKKVSNFKPDLILLDVLMSGTDGRHICKELKNDLVTKKIPVIMISAHPTAKKGAEESGADGFLAKPFDTTQLLETLKKHSRS
jgi:DNA-binding response OmpR family regulator